MEKERPIFYLLHPVLQREMGIFVILLHERHHTKANIGRLKPTETLSIAAFGIRIKQRCYLYKLNIGLCVSIFRYPAPNVKWSFFTYFHKIRLSFGIWRGFKSLLLKENDINTRYAYGIVLRAVWVFQHSSPNHGLA